MKQAEKDPSLLEFYSPFQLKFFMKSNITVLSCSSSHAIAITDKGYAYGWGCNKHFQLGIGTSTKYEYIP